MNTNRPLKETRLTEPQERLLAELKEFPRCIWPGFKPLHKLIELGLVRVDRHGVAHPVGGGKR